MINILSIPKIKIIKLEEKNKKLEEENKKLLEKNEELENRMEKLEEKLDKLYSCQSLNGYDEEKNQLIDLNLLKWL